MCVGQRPISSVILQNSAHLDFFGGEGKGFSLTWNLAQALPVSASSALGLLVQAAIPISSPFLNPSHQEPHSVLTPVRLHWLSYPAVPSLFGF